MFGGPLCVNDEAWFGCVVQLTDCIEREHLDPCKSLLCPTASVLLCFCCVVLCYAVLHVHAVAQCVAGGGVSHRQPGSLQVGPDGDGVVLLRRR